MGAVAAAGRVRTGRGGGSAIADLLSIARLPPGHDPGADRGVATAARQRWHLAIRHFGLFGGPVAAANDYLTTGDRYVRTNKRPRQRRRGTVRRRRGTARRITAITAIRTDHGGHGRSRPATAGHGRSRPNTAGHGRTRRSRPATAECFGRGHGGGDCRFIIHRPAAARFGIVMKRNMFKTHIWPQ